MFVETSRDRQQLTVFKNVRRFHWITAGEKGGGEVVGGPDVRGRRGSSD